jgi:hypothetical protein
MGGAMPISEKARQGAICLMIAALGMMTSCGCESGATSSDSDAGSDADSDADSDSDSDDEHDTSDECGDECYCDEPTCENSCDPYGVVETEPSGTAGELDAICASTASLVVSTAAARVRLSTSGAQNVATGAIEIPEDIRSRVEGLPFIEFESADDVWGTFDITSVAATTTGFAFDVSWPLVPSALDCDVGDGAAFISCRVRFLVACEGADGGASEDAGADGGGAPGPVAVEVEAVTNLQWGYNQEFAPAWYSSGDYCPLRCYWYWEPCPA